MENKNKDIKCQTQRLKFLFKTKTGIFWTCVNNFIRNIFESIANFIDLMCIEDVQ